MEDDTSPREDLDTSMDEQEAINSFVFDDQSSKPKNDVNNNNNNAKSAKLSTRVFKIAGAPNSTENQKSANSTKSSSKSSKSPSPYPMEEIQKPPKSAFSAPVTKKPKTTIPEPTIITPKNAALDLARRTFQSEKSKSETNVQNPSGANGEKRNFLKKGDRWGKILDRMSKPGEKPLPTEKKNKPSEISTELLQPENERPALPQGKFSPHFQVVLKQREEEELFSKTIKNHEKDMISSFVLADDSKKSSEKKEDSENVEEPTDLLAQYLNSQPEDEKQKPIEKSSKSKMTKEDIMDDKDSNNDEDDKEGIVNSYFRKYLNLDNRGTKQQENNNKSASEKKKNSPVNSKHEEEENEEEDEQKDEKKDEEQEEPRSEDIKTSLKDEEKTLLSSFIFRSDTHANSSKNKQPVEKEETTEDEYKNDSQEEDEEEEEKRPQQSPKSQASSQKQLIFDDENEEWNESETAPSKNQSAVQRLIQKKQQEKPRGSQQSLVNQYFYSDENQKQKIEKKRQQHFKKVEEEKAKQAIDEMTEKLKNEISKYTDLSDKLRKGTEELKVQQEILRSEKETFKRWKENEVRNFEEYKENEIQKISRDKKLIDKEKNFQKNQIIPKEEHNKVIEQLNAKIDQLTKTLKQTEAKNKKDTERMQEKIDSFTNQNKELEKIAKQYELEKIDNRFSSADKKQPTKSIPMQKKNELEAMNLLKSETPEPKIQKAPAKFLSTDDEEINAENEDDSFENQAPIPKSNNNNKKSALQQNFEEDNEEEPAKTQISSKSQKKPEISNKKSPSGAKFSLSNHIIKLRKEFAIPQETEDENIFQNDGDIDPNEEVISKIQHPNSKIETVFASGKRIIEYPNNAKKIYNSDGDVITFFHNGDIKKTFSKSGKIMYYYSSKDTTQSVYPNGLETYQFGSYQFEKHYPDGTKEIYIPDGTVKFFHPSGEEQVVFNDGSVQSKSAIDQSTKIILPDGRVVYK